MTKRLVQGNEAVLLGAIRAGASYFRRLSDQPLIRDPGAGFGVRDDSSRVPDSCRPKTRSPAPTRSWREPGPVPNPSPPPRPGLQLMQEAIGYGHKIGIPCVIVNVMRVGPGNRHADDAGTGRPQPEPRYGSTATTRASSSIRPPFAECYQYAIHAFNAAEESRTPVIFLSDAFLAI